MEYAISAGGQLGTVSQPMVELGRESCPWTSQGCLGLGQLGPAVSELLGWTPPCPGLLKAFSCSALGLTCWLGMRGPGH